MIIALSFVPSGLAVLAFAAVAVAAVKRTSICTNGDNSPVTVGRLPDTTIAALEDALAYLALAADAQGAEKEDAAQQSLALAAFILQQQRAGEYRHNTTVAELVERYRECKKRANNGQEREMST